MVGYTQIIRYIQIIDPVLITAIINLQGTTGITQTGKWTTELPVVALDHHWIRELHMNQDLLQDAGLLLNIQQITKVHLNICGVAGKHSKDLTVPGLVFLFFFQPYTINTAIALHDLKDMDWTCSQQQYCYYFPGCYRSITTTEKIFLYLMF